MNRSLFLALVAPPGALEKGRLRAFIEGLAARGMTVLIDLPGLRILGDPEAAQLSLADGQGLIWGHLFDRSTNARVPAPAPASLSEQSAEDLLRNYWGGYVAIRQLGDRVEILRDPSGMVSCYHAEVDGVHIVTSQPHLLFEGLLRPEIDWTIVAQSLVYRDFRPARTALRGVNELLPGVALIWGTEGIASRCMWSPWDFALGEAQISDMSVAVARLRDVVTATLGAWAGCFDRPLIEISGGLDSSIVAAGMKIGGSNGRCLTFGPGAGDASELPWARAVASRLGFDLIERVADAATVDILHSDAQALPRPCVRAFSQALDRPIQALARELDADAFVGGGGGDSMFCLLHSALPVIDRCQVEGLGFGLIETAGDIAQLTRTNIWKVLGVAARRIRSARSAMPKAMTNAFLAKHVSQALPWPDGNPWISAPRGVAPGKRRHVWSVVAIQNQLEGYGREAIAPLLSPLMSQPIAETCLAIPSWMWCAGGNNRAVAREAFRDQLPAAVIDRRTKVSFSNLAYRMIRANLPLLREMLLGGSLAREGMVDAKQVSGFLDGTLADSDRLPELMALVEVEAWVRHWEGSAAARR